MAQRPLAESLAALSRFFVGDLSVQDALQRVSEHLVEALPVADFVGITMLIEGRARTAVFTDPEAPEIDQAQYETGDGPCLTAFRDKRVQTIRSTREDGPWAAFRAAALDHGILSTLSLPMIVGERAVGAMNLYSRVEDGFGEAEREVAVEFASHAAITLANAQAYWDAHDLGTHLGEAMRHRAVIEQAKGILMATQRCTDDEAFDLLVKASQRENVKVRDLAKRIVDNAVAGGAEALPEVD